MSGLSKSEVFWDRASDTKMLMAWSRDLLMCAFRGTDSWANARSDIQVSILEQVNAPAGMACDLLRCLRAQTQKPRDWDSSVRIQLRAHAQVHTAADCRLSLCGYSYLAGQLSALHRCAGMAHHP